MIKRHISGFAIKFLGMAGLLAGSLFAQAPKESLTEEFSYQMIQEDGTNASAVAWDSKNEVFVTVIAGNALFPLEVFDAKGKAISQVAAGGDLRGLWYNEASHALEGNGPGENGWMTCTLDADQVPGTMTAIRYGQSQPAYNSVGAFDEDKKQVVFLDYSVDGLALYSRKNPKKIKKLNLDFASSDLGNINSTTVGFSHHSNYEFVLLDYQMGRLVFFDRSGRETASAQLPEDAPLNEAFAFSFAHDRAFLYDIEQRIWHAYKVW